MIAQAQEPHPIYDAVLAAHEAGISVVPSTEDGAKMPITAWKVFQQERPTPARLSNWYVRDGRQGVGYVTGHVSRGLRLLEFEDEETRRAFFEAARGVGLGGLADRVAGGYESASPGGGYHYLVFCDDPAAPGNTKLARRLKQPDEMRDEHDKYRVLAETKEEGGYTLEPPSCGGVHPSGRAYRLLRGGVDTIAEVTPDEWRALKDLARTLDQLPPEPPREPRRPTDGANTGDRPGDDFNRRADWDGDVLGPFGWTFLHRRGATDYLRRPGKDHGISATTNHGGSDFLWVFSSSTPFEPERSYTKFGAYTVLHHGGDFAAATRDLSARGYGAPRRSTPPPPSPPPREQPPKPTAPTPAVNLTDLGNARRLVRHHGQDLRYCHLWSKWLVWDGRRWRPDDSGEVFRRAKQAIGSIYQEAAGAADDDERKAIAKHALRSEGEARIKAMVALAESEPGVPVRPDDLDRDPWLLTVSNGTIDLKTGELRAHDRTDLITKLAPVAYDELATCPAWLAFLDRVLEGKADLIEFIQRALGYSFTGITTERVVFILWGVGRNGKSTMLETVMTVLGDYGVRTPTDTLLAKRDSGIPNDVARLKGMRFVFASEAQEGRKLDEAKVKDLTGGDTVSARFMRGEFFDFRPEFTLFLGTNHKPVIRGTDHAIWDRIRLIPFAVRIPEAEQDKNLREKLLAEASGILAWAVQGCRAWQRDGLGAPADVKAATAGYRREMDTLADFLADRCVTAPTATVSAKDLYAAYQGWCDETGERPQTQKAIGLRLAERGFDSAQVGKARTRTWFGLGLVTHNTPPDGDEGVNASGGRTHRNAYSDITEPSTDPREDIPKNAFTRVHQANAFTPDDAGGGPGDDPWTA